TYTVTTSPPSLMLHPAAGASSVFTGWGADCASYGTNDCQLTMSANRTATAVFTAQYTVTVSFAGAAAGTVVVQPSNTTCTSPTPCTVTVNSGTAVALTAKPTNNGNTVSSVLTGWTGACAGNGPMRFCNLTVSANTTTTARFDTIPANFVFATSKTFA